MAHWYIKELSKLTKVTVRTLHHYDEIGLLKPSMRQANGYRLYSETDLLKLELIQALKYFGFKLSKIAQLLSKNSDLLSHLRAQKHFLQEQLSHFKDADLILSSIIHKMENGSIDYTDIVKLIEGFQMSDVKYYTWDSEQQKEYEEQMVQSGKMTRAQIVKGHEKVKHWDKAKWEAIGREGTEINQALVIALQKNLIPSDPIVQDLILKHYQMICHFWVPNKEKYKGLAQGYLAPDFRTYYDPFHPKLAEYLVEGIKIFADRELS